MVLRTIPPVSADKGSSKRKPGSGRHLLLALLSSSALLAPLPALAQSAGEAGPSTTLETITVYGGGQTAIGPDATIVAKDTSTGSKTATPILDLPSSVSVVTEEEMRERGVATLDQAISYTAGVSTDIYGSDDRYDFYLIRGFYSGGSKYRDGLPIRTQNFTTSRLEPYGMQRIEVLKGSTSALFGLNGPGGIVNAITKRPQSEKFGEIYTTLGEDHVETGTDFGGVLDENGDWSYRLTAKWQDGNNGADFTDDDRIYIAPALTWNPTDATTFTILTDYNKRDGSPGTSIPLGSGLDTKTFLGEPDFNNMDTIERNIGYSFEHDFGNGLQFRQVARHTNLDLDYETVYGASADPTVRRTAFAVYGELESFAIDNQLQYDASFGRFDSRTLLGLEYTRTTTDETRYDGSAAGIDIYDPSFCGVECITWTSISNSDFGMTTKGLYLQEELTLDDRWILTLGGRYDHVDSSTGSSAGSYGATDEAFTKRVGLTYKATNEVSLYANYSESFEPVGANRTSFTSPPQPQEGEQYEVGVKYAPTAFDALFTLAFFDLTQNNVAQWNATYTEQIQIGQVNVRGVELEGKVALTDSTNLTLAYSYWDPKIEKDLNPDLVGNRPERVPNHLASIWADYTIPGNGTIGDVTLGLGARFVGKTYGDIANTNELSSRTVFDAAVNYKVTENASLQVNATNLFDKEYVTHVDTWSNSAWYGDRRTVKATLRYTW